MKLYTVTTNCFHTKQILSDLSKDELETKFIRVEDCGTVSNVRTSMQSGDLLFKHNGWEKKLPHENRIDSLNDI